MLTRPLEEQKSESCSRSSIICSYSFITSGIIATAIFAYAPTVIRKEQPSVYNKAYCNYIQDHCVDYDCLDKLPQDLNTSEYNYTRIDFYCEPYDGYRLNPYYICPTDTDVNQTVSNVTAAADHAAGEELVAWLDKTKQETIKTAALLSGMAFLLGGCLGFFGTKKNTALTAEYHQLNLDADEPDYLALEEDASTIAPIETVELAQRSRTYKPN